MEIGFLISTLLLLAFALLATWDGLYLHLLKYQLFNHPESQHEHLAHTLRALLFPAILYFFFLRQDCLACFWVGLGFVLLDLLVSLADAWMEKGSRAWMGGLPRWEYIIHLLVNGFHFATIALLLTLKLQTSATGIRVITDFSSVSTFGAFEWLATNLLPGAVAIGILHALLAVPMTRRIWNGWRARLACC